MFKPIPTLLCDFYKVSHRQQYPDGTTLVYSNFTPRNGKYYKGNSDKVIFFGLRYFIKNVLIDLFNEQFFNRPKSAVIAEYSRVIKHCLFIDNPDVSHIEALHDLGYLPLEIRALPEMSLVNYNVPVLTVENTHPDFYWLTNFIETSMSSDLWMMCNNATLAFDYRNLCETAASKTCDDNLHIDFQCHDFSFRGMACHEAATMSGMAHLTQFKGTDTIPAISAMEYFYDKDITQELVGTSIPASEHAVMCAGGKESEFDTYKRFITDLYPNGLVSIVSDTWDFFNVLTDILPRLKTQIMARDGKVVIRPDSGNPVDIICGDRGDSWFRDDYFESKDSDGNYLVDYYCPMMEYNQGKAVTPNEYKGAIELLWDTFGGTINSKGYKVLDSHIGLIYGDSITLERAKLIFERLEAKGFASSNVVFGVGSYTYQFNTRDSQGWAMKATYCEVNGVGREIFKQPKTDSGKTSARGLLKVTKEADNYVLYDQQTKSLQSESNNLLRTVFINGEYLLEI